MEKARLITITAAIFMLIFSACNGDERSRRAGQSSSGQPYELIVVYDGDTTIRNAINRVLGQPFPALPQPESWFDLRFVHIDNLVNLHKRQRNIMFAGSIEKGNKLGGIIRDLFGDETIDQVLENPDRFYSSSRDVWSSPQVIIALYETSTERLAAKINEHGDFLLDQLDASEVRRLRNTVKSSPANSRLAATLENKHDLTFHVLTLFSKGESLTADENETLQRLGVDGFIWLRGETEKTNQELMIYYEAYKSPDQLLTENILSKRDSIGKYFIPGPVDGSYMQTEWRYIPRQKEIELNGMYAVETRGLWRVEGDFMGGPFVNFAVYDDHNERVIYLDGFLYAPQTRKRNFIKRIELILKTLEVPGRVES